MIAQLEKNSAAYRNRVKAVFAQEHYEASLIEGLVRETVSLADRMEELYQIGIDGLIGMGQYGGSLSARFPRNNDSRRIVVDDAALDKPFSDTLAILSAIVCDFLGASEMIFPHDKEASIAIVRQANRVAQYERDLISAWPWIDRMEVEEAHQQYEAGTLMDLETFRNGLRGI